MQVIQGIIVIILFILSAVLAALCRVIYQFSIKKNIRTEKFVSYYHILNRWMELRESGLTLAEELKNAGYGRVAIYGMGDLGKHLYWELKNSDIVIPYAIDSNKTLKLEGLKIIAPEEYLEEADAVVVTAAYEFSKIEEKLSGKIKCPIISLEDLIYETA